VSVINNATWSLDAAIIPYAASYVVSSGRGCGEAVAAKTERRAVT